MKYAVDIDGTLCLNGKHHNYANAIPQLEVIKSINHLYDARHTIQLHTSRLEIDRQVTKEWLEQHGVKYHGLTMEKLDADVYVDDKAINFVPNLGGPDARKNYVICYSGGMDSTAAYLYATEVEGISKDDIIMLNFDIHHPYRDKERRAMESLSKDCGIEYHSIDLNICDTPFRDGPTVDKYIIPGRNMIFASIAASFGKEVWIVGSKFEDHPLMYDKNSGFYRTMTLAASQAIGSTTVVKTPFYEQTKTDMVKLFINTGNQDMLSHTVSCYHPEHKRCGNCGLCFKRAIALRANGVEEHYTNEPFRSKDRYDFVAKYQQALKDEDFSHYSKERIEETLSTVARWDLANGL